MIWTVSRRCKPQDMALKIPTYADLSSSGAVAPLRILLIHLPECLFYFALLPQWGVLKVLKCNGSIGVLAN